MQLEKQKVHDFWNQASCGENLYLNGIDKDAYERQAHSRYELEGDIIFPFARFTETAGQRVLEVGVGLGADHQEFAQAGADLYGIDITHKAMEHTQRRLTLFNLHSNLSVGDAEALDFVDEQFDLVYSWGVLHHSPNTTKAFSEVFRTLKKGGVAKIMIYHKWSLIGYMLWVRFALLRFKPWLSLSKVYSQYLESPGTKAYSKKEVQKLFSDFEDVIITTNLTHADLLQSNIGQRHKKGLLTFIKKLWPRWFFIRFMPNSGLFLLIEARK